jgi:hypothetical protein
MSFRIKRDIKKGGLLGVVKRTKTPGTVDVGVIDAGEHEIQEGKVKEATVALIALWNEFGTLDENGDVHIPERSFFRSTLIEERSNIIKLQKKLVSKIILGETTTERALGLIGEFVADKVSQKIVDLKTPENATSTLKAKRPKTNPLIDTGQLKNSITYEVNR